MWSPARVNTGNKAQMHYQLISWLCDASVTMCFVLKGGGWKNHGAGARNKSLYGSASACCCESPRGNWQGAPLCLWLALVAWENPWCQSSASCDKCNSNSCFQSGDDRNKMLMEKNDIMGTSNVPNDGLLLLTMVEIQYLLSNLYFCLQHTFVLT